MMILLIQQQSVEIDWPAWIQAISAFLATIGLIWTLQLQRKTANDQKELLKIESNKDRREVMPEFQVSEDVIIENNAFFIALSSKGRAGYNLKLLVDNEQFITEDNLRSSYPYFNSQFNTKIRVSTPLMYDDADVKLLKLKFEDIDRRKYIQQITVTYEGLRISPPLWYRHEKVKGFIKALNTHSDNSTDF